jgi:hypothetical protein
MEGERGVDSRAPAWCAAWEGAAPLFIWRLTQEPTTDHHHHLFCGGWVMLAAAASKFCFQNSLVHCLFQRVATNCIFEQSTKNLTIFGHLQKQNFHDSFRSQQIMCRNLDTVLRSSVFNSIVVLLEIIIERMILCYFEILSLQLDNSITIIGVGE